MELDEIWESFTARMAEIELLLRTTKASAHAEIELLIKNEKNLEQSPDVKKHFRSMHNMSFRNVQNGEHLFYHQKDLTLEDAKRHLFYRKNRQYQWLLAESYERFEQYIVQIYAFVGLHSKDVWPMRDYGNITIVKAEEMTYDQYFKQAKGKKDLPHSILALFRKRYPALTNAEISNFRELNLKFAVTLIEKLRHIIVHKAGWADSKDNFLQIVAKQAGILNNGNIAQENSEFVNNFFGAGEYENMVALLEVPTNQEIPIGTYICRVGILLEILLGYGYLLFQLVKSDTQANQA